MTRLFGDVRSSAPPRRSPLSLPVSLVLHAAGFACVLALPLFTPLDLPAPAAGGPLVYRLPLAPAVVQAATRPALRPARVRHAGSAGAGVASKPGLVSSANVPASIPEGIPTADVSALDDGLPLGPGCRGAACGAGLPADTAGDGDGAPTDGDASARAPFVAGREVSPPLKLYDARPAYPELALRLRVQGDVTLTCTLAPDGRVVDLHVDSGPPLLREAALEAVRQWRYRPTLVGGRPVAVLLAVTVRFRIGR